MITIRYLNFIENYSNSNNSYNWCPNVRYGIQKEDTDNYYIQGDNYKLYPLSKSLQNQLYKIIMNDTNKKE